jgi:hypothetical protein
MKLLLFSFLLAVYEKYTVLIKFALTIFFIPQYIFSYLFDLPPISLGTSVDPSGYTV